MDWFQLEDSTTAPRIARGYVRDVLGPAISGERVVTSELLVSEVVTNAVIHALGPLSIGFDCKHHRLRVEVRDSDNTGLPVVVDAADDQLGGWGLRLVEVLASRWGTCTTDGGKVVWFELQLD